MNMILEGKILAVIGGNGLLGVETVNSIVKHGGTVETGSRSGNIAPTLLDNFSSEERKRVNATKVDVNNPESVEIFFKDIGSCVICV